MWSMSTDTGPSKHSVDPISLREMADDCERFNNTPPIQAEECQRLYLRVTRHAPRYLREAAEALEQMRPHETTDDALSLMYECRDALALYSQHEELYRKIWRWCQERQQKGSPEEPAGKLEHDEECENCGEGWSKHLTNKLICPDAAIQDVYRFRQKLSPQKASGNEQ
jgi:hypothetical protein